MYSLLPGPTGDPKTKRIWIFSPEATISLLKESQLKVTLISQASSSTFNQVTKSSQYFFRNKPILSISPLSFSWARPSPPTSSSLMLQDQRASEITVSFFSLLWVSPEATPSLCQLCCNTPSPNSPQ